MAFGYNFSHKIDFEKSADYKIFCVGESSTWGIGASDPLEKNYPRQLERLLSHKFPGKNVKCFFDQTIGQNTSEILFKLPKYIEEYKPNLIILMVGVNNWWNLDKSNALLFTKNRFIANATFRVKIFLDRLRVWKLSKWIAYSLGLANERWDYWYPVERMDDIGGYEKEIREEYNMEILYKVSDHDIRKMIEYCRGKGVPVILASYPGGSSKELYRLQKEIAAEFQIPYVDNASFFSSLSNRKEFFSADKWHPNDKGYKLTADNFYEVIMNNKLFPESEMKIQPLQKTGIIVFEEKFESKDKMNNNWQTSEGASYGKGYSVLQDNGNHILKLSGSTYSDPEKISYPSVFTSKPYFLQKFSKIKFRLKIERGGFDFYFRCNPDYTYYLVHFAQNYISLSRFDQGKQLVMAEKEMVSLKDRWCRVTINDNSGRISIHIDDSLMFSSTEKTPLKPGKIQFGTSQESSICFIDDISVTNTDPNLKTMYTVEVDVEKQTGNRKKKEECVTLWTYDKGTIPFTSDGPMANRLKDLDFKYLRIRAIGDEGWLGGGVTVHKNDDGELIIDFSNLDETVGRIIEMGMEPFMRLGWEMPEDLVDTKCASSGNYWTCPPGNYAEWEDLVYQIVKHFNVDNNLNIKWWVVWNEPDIEEFGGDKELGLRNVANYLKLYEASVKGALRADPSIKIGGPGIAGSCGEGPVFGESCFWTPVGEPNQSIGFLEAFLEFCAKKKVRLDFLLFHKYRLYHPRYYVKLIEEMRALAASYGLSPEMVLDEWTLWELPQNEKTAAYVASSLQYFQKAGLDLACYTSFNGFNNENKPLKSYPEGIGLAMIDGRVIKPPYFAFKMYSLLGDTYLTSTVDGHLDISLDDSIGVVSTKNTKAVQILIWRYDDLYQLNKSLQIEVKNLESLFPDTKSFYVKGYLIDKTHSNSYNDYVIKQKDNQGGLFNLESAKLEEVMSFQASLENNGLFISTTLDGYSVLLLMVAPAK